MNPFSLDHPIYKCFICGELEDECICHTIVFDDPSEACKDCSLHVCDCDGQGDLDKN